MLGFPITGITGTTHTIGDITWEWNGYAWQVIVSTIAGLSGPKGDTGNTGNTGNTGIGISGTTLTNYELIFTYTNGVTQNIGNIRGDTGAPGATGTPGTAGTQGNTGNTGNTGIGISGASLSNYELLITYTNGVTQNIGYIRGDTGSPGVTGSPGTAGTAGAQGNTGNTGNTGVGISGATLTNYELIFTYTDGTTQNIGNIRGPSGADGQATSSGAAGTKIYAIFTPLDNEPPATNYATIDTVNSISVLDFDGTTQESAIFRSMIPEGASFSNLLATLYFTASTVTGGVVWGVQWEKLTGGGISGDRFTGGVTGLATLGGATSTPVGITLLSTSYGGLTVGDPYRVKIYRDAANAADGMGGDAELLIVEIQGA